ncbi:hypothetical protein EB796_015641 [Bugula neritina]|uniref:Uncharacterized protein n=1 Tax=Bugula neritina TaxID=10212 RepID=A0A7J7JKA1_BUGNE|nr:hypothetical protein EB796_015641 [Bugula neritina]
MSMVLNVGNNLFIHVTADELDDDDLSDLSEDNGSLQSDRENKKGIKLIQLELKPTTNPRIKQLFSNTDKVNVSADEHK